MTGDRNSRFLAGMVQAVRERLVKAHEGESADGTPQVLDLADAGWAPREEIPGLLSLAAAFGLSAFEIAVLALCAAFELDTGIGLLCGGDERGNAGKGCACPNFALALALFDGGSWDALAPDRPLRAWRLIELELRPDQPLISAAMRCDERVMNHIKGLHCLDDRLASLLEPIPAVDSGLGEQAARLATVWSRTDDLAAMLTGSSTLGRAAVAAEAAQLCGRQLFRLDAGTIGGTALEMDLLVRLWQREDALAPLALLIDLRNLEVQFDGSILRFICRLGCPAAVSADHGLAAFAAALTTIEVPRPGRADQEEAWEAGLAHAGLARTLAGDFDLDLPTIRRIAAIHGSGPKAVDTDRESQLREACRAGARPTLDALAHRITVRASWDQLALPAGQRSCLGQIIDQMHLRRQVHEAWGFGGRGSRGLGITVLFAGESGTGKTMAAEVVSHALDLDLYRIDLSAMVSKYIGETEKNLCRIFDAAERGGVALLFDEADALFGKRSEVKDSHDRYANVGVSYLLQRLESFGGLAILTTNMKAALDAAFMRRLRFVVQFPYPGAAERVALWRSAFPAVTPLAGLDHERLARLNLTGGNIANAALNAAFLAAAEDTPVGMRHVLSAARDEMLKLDRVMNEADFAWSAPPALASAAE